MCALSQYFAFSSLRYFAKLKIKVINRHKKAVVTLNWSLTVVKQSCSVTVLVENLKKSTWFIYWSRTAPDVLELREGKR